MSCPTECAWIGWVACPPTKRQCIEKPPELEENNEPEKCPECPEPEKCPECPTCKPCEKCPEFEPPFEEPPPGWKCEYTCEKIEDCEPCNDPNKETGNDDGGNDDSGIDPIEDPIKNPVIDPLPTPPGHGKQLTPTYDPSGIRTGPKWVDRMSQISIEKGHKNHSPSGIKDITGDQWKKTIWDGNPKYKPSNICTLSKEQMCEYAFPGGLMLGLKQEYERDPPFKDEMKPTMLEIEDWHIRVINHFRSLFGLKTKIQKDRCLYLRSLWAEQRNKTNHWDSKYGTLDTRPMYGPCFGKQPYNYHCGWVFVPDCEDQKPYLTGNLAGQCCLTPKDPGFDFGAEGGLDISASTPWSFKLANFIGGYLCKNGPTNHVGPFFHSTHVGMSFELLGDESFGYARAIWTGHGNEFEIDCGGKIY